jgi:Na+-translocating ferredoxin:NAD+ oxidoreductase subunit A
MNAGSIFLMVLGAILVNNVVFARFLGICPYLGVSTKVETALGMGGAVVFVMTLAVAVTWPLQRLVLEPLGLGYLRTIAFILIIASLVQLVEIVMKKLAKNLFDALGIYLPLITTNCAILGVAILSLTESLPGSNYLVALLYGFASALGFTMALVIFAGLREHMELYDIPQDFKGVPIALITAGILAMGFMGFAGLGG